MTDKPRSLKDIIATMNPEIHQQLKHAVELGRWENGEKLSKEQQEHCLQAVIAYEKKFVQPEQRVGYINTEKNSCSSKK